MCWWLLSSVMRMRERGRESQKPKVSSLPLRRPPSLLSCSFFFSLALAEVDLRGLDNYCLVFSRCAPRSTTPSMTFADTIARAVVCAHTRAPPDHLLSPRFA